MYLVIQNLPRSARYKTENIILVGIIPGPKEPKYTINSFLRPLVEELKEFWIGIDINCKYHPLGKVFVRAALTCCVSDIPATRKLCGFVGHSAALGCSKCAKRFTYNEDERRMNFSGYDCEDWPARTLSNHLTECIKHLNAATQAEKRTIEKEHGVRYSALIELPYFDPMQHAVVDPMHNLFLGTAKHVMQVWISQEILCKQHFDIIEQIVSKIKSPYDVGRLPLKISSSFSAFTADQWRNWVTVYSVVSLKGILHPDHLRCWLLFVRACNMLCTRIITIDAIRVAHCYLVEFCRQYVSLYGEENCTPNMHLHLHLKECLLDYGPVQSFWCYPFERFNGVMGKYHTNNNIIELQIMEKFLTEQKIKSLIFTSKAAGTFTFQENLSGSLKESSSNEYIFKFMSFARSDNLHSDYSNFLESEIIDVLPPHFSGTLTNTETQYLKSLYKFLYPDINIIHISPFYTSAKKCVIANELFTTSNTRQKSSVIMAYWPVENCTSTLELQVGIIKQFLKHKIKVVVNETTKDITHIFCKIDWHIKHVQANWYGTSAILCTNMTYAMCPYSFMPVQRILHRCAYGRLEVVLPPRSRSEQVVVAIPVHLKYFI